MRVYVTGHAAKMFRLRYPIKGADPVKAAELAWKKGTLPDDHLADKLFRLWSRHPERPMQEYRVYKGFVFVFQSGAIKWLRLITVYAVEQEQM